MPAMNTGVPVARNAADGNRGAAALPRVSYYPPIIATLLGALFIFLICAALGVVMIGNTGRQMQNVANNADGSSPLVVAFCGLLSLLFVGGALYMLMAVIKGVRDLVTPVQYTRGAVVDQQAMAGRRVKNWLLVDPVYSGPDMARATACTDEQIAASVDRTQIVQPRFSGLRWPGRGQDRGSTPYVEESTTPQGGKTSGGYLSPERISGSAETPEKNAANEPAEEKAPNPHVIFRADFVSRAQLHGGEEVIVAHSRFLQHPFYVARLLDGEWQVHKNKGLI